MNILFLHRSFPGQFKNLIKHLSQDSTNKLIFITDNNLSEMEGVLKVLYSVNKTAPESCHPYLRNYTNAIFHAQASASMALGLKQQGFKPDLIYGFSGWGNAMFIKDVFPDVPFLSYYEWYYDSNSPDIAYNKIRLNEDQKAQIRCKNSKFLIDLYSSDAGICPTNWQKQQFPKEFHNKMKVIHDGIDTEICKPDENAKFLVKDKNLELSTQDEVITYVARGFEPYRGFPEFMKSLEVLLKKRPNAHAIIAGEDVVCYGQKVENSSYKKYYLEKLNLDMNRVHFVGPLVYDEYIKLLQVSSVHIYLTFPFILSWSILEAMSTGCCVVASSTEPVLEVIKNNYNGLLADIQSIQDIVEKTIFALENQNKMKEIRDNARKTIIENYEAKDMVQKQLEYINEVKGEKTRCVNT